MEELARRGYTAAQISEMLGSDINRAAEYTKVWGGSLGTTTTKIISMNQAAVKAAQRAKDFAQAWATAMANLTTRIAEGLAESSLKAATSEKR